MCCETQPGAVICSTRQFCIVHDIRNTSVYVFVKLLVIRLYLSRCNVTRRSSLLSAVWWGMTACHDREDPVPPAYLRYLRVRWDYLYTFPGRNKARRQGGEDTTAKGWDFLRCHRRSGLPRSEIRTSGEGSNYRTWGEYPAKHPRTRILKRTLTRAFRFSNSQLPL
ncbi:hypothetical protein VTG60DRAFT_5186 [Thermothelomyces hinnuleus]